MGGDDAKVFCLGFQKTGTTSVGRALRHLGFRVRGNAGFNAPGKKFRIDGEVTREKLIDMVSPLLTRFDAFEDNPWCFLYPELDKLYPGSKFILVERKRDEWLKSMVRHFGDRQSPMNAFIYGSGKSPVAHPEHCLQVYRTHNEGVRDYFEGRPDDLLVMSLTDLAWEPLCAFLGKPVPSKPFPHANSAADRKAAGRSLVKTAVRGVRRTLSGFWPRRSLYLAWIFNR